MKIDSLIKFRIVIDSATGQISDYCSRRNVRRLLLTLKWLAIVYILYHTFIFSWYSGNSALFSGVLIALVTSFLTRKRAQITDEVVDETDSVFKQLNRVKNKCEKCGADVRINYGNAYTTLCEKCA